MKTDDKNVELLNYIYQNAEMGVVGINQIEDKIEDISFKEIILDQREEYQNIQDAACEIFKKYGKDEKALGTMPKIMSYLMTNAKTLTDHSTKVLAKMLVEGSNKGIIEINEKINQNLTEDEEIIKLANKLLRTEENNIEELTPYL